MNNEMSELQSQVARISVELADARRTIRSLEARRRGRSPAALWLGILVTIVALTSWAGYARTPMSPSEQMSDLITRVTALEQSKNKVTAPFEVVDSAGKPIVKVDRDKSGASGLWTMSPAGKVMAFIGSNAEGNAILAASGADGQEAVLGIGSLGMGYVEINNNRGPIVRLGKVAQDDAPGLRVWDAGGKVAGSLVSAPEGGRLQIYTTAGQEVAVLHPTQSEEGGMLEINNIGYYQVVRAGINESGKASVLVQDQDGYNGSIGVGVDGKMGIRVNNRQSHNLAALGVGVDGNGDVLVRDKSGKSTARVGADEGGGFFSVHDGPGPALAMLSASDGRGWLKVFHSGGVEAAVLEASEKQPGSGVLTIWNAGTWAAQVGFINGHGEVAMGGKGKVYSLWASAASGFLK